MNSIMTLDRIKMSHTKQTDNNLSNHMHKTTKIGGLALIAIVGIISLWLVPTAQAQPTVRYWDTDGTNPGLGVGGPYDWTLDNLWNTDPAGGSAGVTGGWTDGDTPVFNGNGVSTVTFSSTINCVGFAVGNSAVDGTAATLNLSGSGTLNCGGGYFGVGFQAADITATNNSAVLNLTGGAVNLNSSLFVGRFGCSGTLNLSGGASLSGVQITSVGEGAYPGGGTTTANGTINVSNAVFSPGGNLNMGFSAGIEPIPTVATLNINSGGTALFGTAEVCYTSNTVATINVNNGGILLANLLIRGANANGSQLNTTATLNFNGGCFRGRKSGQPTIGQDGNFSAPFDAINVQSGGVIFDTAGFTLYITQGLLDGGGGGGLLKTNNGNLVLEGVNTYTGGTTIKQGSFYLGVYSPFLTSNGSIDDSAFINIYPGATVNLALRSDDTLTVTSGQILEGGGTISGNATVNGTLEPGNSWAPSTMSLDVVGVATLAGTTILDLNRTNAVNSDRLVSNHPITCGGALIVTNVGPALVAGDTFTLFTPTGGFSGTFSSTNLPALPGSLAWVTTNLSVNGSISVVAVASQAPVFTHNDYSQVSSGTIGFNATNGTPNGSYTLLTTTNIALPINLWTALTNGNFDANGNLNGLYITNLFAPEQFFILKH
jgi:fibronectin-binding autotransporter adhesin